MRLHIVHHFWEGDPPWVHEFKVKMDRLLDRMESFMAQIADLQPILDGIQADVGTVQTGITNLQTQLEDLKTQLANAGRVLDPPQQAALDAAVTEAANIKAALDGVSAAINPVPTPTPTPVPTSTP